VLIVGVRPCDYMGKVRLALLQECVQHDGACHLLNRRKFDRTLAIRFAEPHRNGGSHVATS
jgi:hypothetical protein